MIGIYVLKNFDDHAPVKKLSKKEKSLIDKL